MLAAAIPIRLLVVPGRLSATLRSRDVAASRSGESTNCQNLNEF